jgi:energy-coupling factor transport system permease protein
MALLRATTSGVLDRALDIAATLEVRGYASARRAPPGAGTRRPWSRHDLAFLVAAFAAVAVAVGVRIAGLAPFSAYPVLRGGIGAGAWLGAATFVLVALAPFADRRGIER